MLAGKCVRVGPVLSASAPSCAFPVVGAGPDVEQLAVFPMWFASASVSGPTQSGPMGEVLPATTVIRSVVVPPPRSIPPPSLLPLLPVIVTAVMVVAALVRRPPPNLALFPEIVLLRTVSGPVL